MYTVSRAARPIGSLKQKFQAASSNIGEAAPEYPYARKLQEQGGDKMPHVHTQEEIELTRKIFNENKCVKQTARLLGFGENFVRRVTRDIAPKRKKVVHVAPKGKRRMDWAIRRRREA